MDHLPDIGVPPDFGLSQTGEFLTDVVELGDGYTQRRPKGINPYRRSWSPVWSTLSRAQKDTLVDFLNSRLGVKAFIFTDPDSDEEYKVVCPSPAAFSYDNYDVYSVGATFTEDFNP